jgi:hypothetical protein
MQSFFPISSFEEMVGYLNIWKHLKQRNGAFVLFLSEHA